MPLVRYHVMSFTYNILVCTNGQDESRKRLGKLYSVYVRIYEQLNKIGKM